MSGFKKVALVGSGLIGSSIAHNIRARQLAEVIAVIELSEDRCDEVLRLGLADIATTDLSIGVKDADLVILCTPVGTYAELARNMSEHLMDGAILSDVGSVKAQVISDVAPHVPFGTQFIPGHPIAGTEKSGPNAGFRELFENRWVILTPTQGTEPTAIDRLCRFWEACGAKVETMDADDHDMVLAMTSHLPHLIAYSIVDTANKLESSLKSEVIKYSASGFRDFTRIAGSNPTMWRDIFLTNKSAVLDTLSRFNEDLTVLQKAIQDSDGTALFETFTETRKIRHEVVEQGQAGTFDPREPDEVDSDPQVLTPYGGA